MFSLSETTSGAKDFTFLRSLHFLKRRPPTLAAVGKLFPQTWIHVRLYLFARCFAFSWIFYFRFRNVKVSHTQWDHYKSLMKSKTLHKTIQIAYEQQKQEHNKLSENKSPSHSLLRACEGSTLGDSTVDHTSALRPPPHRLNLVLVARVMRQTNLAWKFNGTRHAWLLNPYFFPTFPNECCHMACSASFMISLRRSLLL